MSGGAGPDRTISPPSEDAVSRELGDREPESGLPIWIELVSPAMGRAFERDFGKPNMTYLSPTQKFEAVIHCDVGKVTADEVRMRLNYKPVDFKYDSSSGRVSWMPLKPLPEGDYLLDISINDDSRFSDWDSWKFKVRYSPPTIEALFRGDKENEVILCLSDSEPLKTLTDTARWSVSKIVEEKSEKNSVMLVEPLGWTQQTVRVTLASKYERSELAAHEIAFNGLRGETKRYFPSDEERRRGISDYDDDMGWLLTHCADEEVRDPRYNICCDTEPKECVFQTRVGDCWEPIEPGDFVDHTHQSQEGEVHCAGTQILGDAQTGASTCLEWFCWQQYEKGKINVNSPNWTDASLMEDHERAEIDLFFTRDDYQEGWDFPGFNISEIGNNVHLIAREISTTYDDWVKINITGSGRQECGNRFWEQLKWDFGGDHYNPIFLDEYGGQTPPGEGIHLGTGEQAYQACLAAGYAQNVADQIDRSDCYTLWFDVRDVSRYTVDEPPGEVETNGRMDGEVAIGVILGQTFHYFTTGQAVGYIDEQPLADPLYGDDPDGWPGERYFFALDLWAVLDNAMNAGLYLPLSELPQYGEDITLQFLLMDDVGNWRKAEIELNQEIHISDPVFVEYQDNPVGPDWDIHVFDQPVLPNPNTAQHMMGAVFEIEDQDSNFFYAPAGYPMTLENGMLDKQPATSADLFTLDVLAGDFPLTADELTQNLRDALEIPLDAERCNCRYFPDTITIKEENTEGNNLHLSMVDLLLDEEDQRQFFTIAGADTSSLSPGHFSKVTTLSISGMKRKGSGIISQQKPKNQWMYPISDGPNGNTEHPSYPSTRSLILSGGEERISVFRYGQQKTDKQKCNISQKSHADLIMVSSHGAAKYPPNSPLKGWFNRIGIPNIGYFLDEAFEPGTDVPWFYALDLESNWLTDGPYPQEIKWLVLGCCGQLDQRVHPAWQMSANQHWKAACFNQNNLEAFCGYQYIILSRINDDIQEKFTDNFDYDQTQTENPSWYWLDNRPDDPAVIAWMEASREVIMNDYGLNPYYFSRQYLESIPTPLAPAANDPEHGWTLFYNPNIVPVIFSSGITYYYMIDLPDQLFIWRESN